MVPGLLLNRVQLIYSHDFCDLSSTACHRCFCFISYAPLQLATEALRCYTPARGPTLGLCNLPGIPETVSCSATSAALSELTAIRTPSHILQSLKDAEVGGYSLGVKLVRGAYHPFEVEASLSPETCPVWMEKKDTDICYNQSVGLLLSALRGDMTNTIPHIGLLFGTHNSESCTRILNGLVLEGIATERDGLVIVDEQAAERCAIGQLFGAWKRLLVLVHGSLIAP
jgi:Proline dehydrogenase